MAAFGRTTNRKFLGFQRPSSYRQNLRGVVHRINQRSSSFLLPPGIRWPSENSTGIIFSRSAKKFANFDDFYVQLRGHVLGNTTSSTHQTVVKWAPESDKSILARSDRWLRWSVESPSYDFIIVVAWRHQSYDVKLWGMLLLESVLYVLIHLFYGLTRSTWTSITLFAML